MSDNVEKKKVITELEFKVNEQQLRKAEMAINRVEAQTAKLKVARGLMADKTGYTYARRGVERTKAVGSVLKTRERIALERERANSISLRNAGIEKNIRKIEAQTSKINESRRLVAEKANYANIRRGLERTKSVGSILNTREKIQLEKERLNTVNARNIGIDNSVRKIEAQTAKVSESKRLIEERVNYANARRNLERTKAVGSAINTREKIRLEKEKLNTVNARNAGMIDREAEKRNTYYTKNALELDRMTQSVKALRDKELSKRSTIRSRTAGAIRTEEEKRITASLRSQLRQSDATQSLYTYEQKLKANTEATVDKWIARTNAQEQALDAKRKYDYDKYVVDAIKLEENLHMKKMALQDKYNLQQERDLQKIANMKERISLKEKERKRQDARYAFKKAEIEENKAKRNFIMRSGFKAVPVISSSQIGAQQDPSFWTRMNYSGLFKSSGGISTVKDNPAKRMRVLSGIEFDSKFEKMYSENINNAINSLVNRRISDIVKDKVSRLSKMKFTKKKNKSDSYTDSTFQKSMMYLGSAMLIQYAVMMGARLVAGTLNATANTEVASLQGRAFRNDLIRRGGNVSQFDAATNEYSRLSGTSGFASRAKFANLFGRLRGAGIDTNQLNGKQLVQTIRGLELYTGDTPEQVDKKLFDLLSGKADKNTRKEFGVTANNNPVEILKQIHTTLANNPVASIGMDASLLKDTLNKIVNAPSEMLDTVHSRFPSIFQTMGETIAKFTDGFFGKLDPDVEKRWIGMFESIKQFMDKVITAESGGAVAKFLTDTVGGFFATLKQMADTVGYLYNDITNNQSLPFRAARYTVGKAFDFTNFAIKAPFRAGQWLYNATHQDEIGPMPNPNKTYLNTSFDTNYSYGANRPYARGYTPGGIIINATNAYTNGTNVTIDNMLNEVSY